MLIDSHCHLDRLDLAPYEGDLTRVIAEAKDRGVSEMLCVGIDMTNAKEVMRIAQANSGVHAAVGIHPMDVKVDELPTAEDFAQLKEWAGNECVIAVGETGLDYYYTAESAEAQQQSFKEHLSISSQVGKPVIVHTRDAREDTLNLIRECGDESIGGVLHCFTESWEMAESALDLNYYISFSGIITFKNASELREVVKRVPVERILVETDSPYLAPVPHRGKKNVPQYVVEVAQCVAELKGISFEEVAEVTTDNFRQLFKLA